MDNGSKRVELAGLYDKCQITAVFCVSLAGEYLPIRTFDLPAVCLPRFVFPDTLDVIHSQPLE